MNKGFYLNDHKYCLLFTCKYTKETTKGNCIKDYDTLEKLVPCTSCQKNPLKCENFIDVYDCMIDSKICEEYGDDPNSMNCRHGYGCDKCVYNEDDVCRLKED